MLRRDVLMVVAMNAAIFKVYEIYHEIGDITSSETMLLIKLHGVMPQKTTVFFRSEDFCLLSYNAMQSDESQ
jgi:hypothetical protein